MGDAGPTRGLIDFLGDFVYAVGGHECVKVKARRSVGYQIAALPDAPFYAEGASVVVVAALPEFGGEGFGDVGAEYAGQYV